MPTSGLLGTVLLLVLANEVSSSNTGKSALMLELCGSLHASKEIIINIITQNDETGQAKFSGDGNTKQYNVKIDGASLQQEDKYQFQSQQKAIKQVTVTSTASHICVNALVIDTIIVVDQPTDFKTTCPNLSPDAVLERPCKQFGVSINVSELFVCPERLKDLLLKQNIVTATPGSQPTDGEPPTYDITNDMLQASSAIAAGLTEGAGTITEARQKYREASKAKPLKKLGTLATTFETASSFISAIAPVFSIFSGIASIATTFLTPNPFDELAKYLDQEFKQINNQLTNIQAEITDLGRLIEAKGGVLAMTDQLSAIRYTIRNYGVLVDAMSKKKVCGARALSEMPEVEEFITQYKYGEPLTDLLQHQSAVAYIPINKINTGAGGGGGTQQIFIRGGSAPRSNPLPFYIPFFTKKVPLSYTFY